ncbi:CAP domain-containing protein [Truepera radiovictrix]|uniref:SCP-like extracellular n=1 Tax=Truepera radiovictrix (strain DSM 17093 / CIP 108686 / LMG 22925 / RQ-24) TaxID=649638 RepID=D7CXR9_TRURR|nr:CAP domain-containing protein [Truepera radiovictrix]ADI14671.1 SCP-like extracellular [Truepera radiovictrix DSM 17093]WMT56779.1 CAP domain-containing protein [Truepera radiovictrix]
MKLPGARFALTVILWGTLVGAAVRAAPAPYPPLPADPTLEAELLNLTNAARAREGLGALVPDEALALAARHHALEMRTLGFFAHTSPTPENATLSRRVARSGSFARVLGENLAWIRGGAVAAESVAGWLSSPGHRANLLSPDFTHVGFGSAAAEDGRTFVAQVFAYLPAPLEAAEVVATPEQVTLTAVRFELTRPAEVALFYEGDLGGAHTPVTALEAGEHTLTTEALGAGEAVHLQLGVRAPGANGSFSAQDEGWLEAGRWRGGGGAPRDGARLLQVTQRRQERRTEEVQLRFAGRLPRGLGGWWGERFFAPTLEETAVGTVLRATVPTADGAEGPPVLLLGEPDGAGTYRVVYGFQLLREGDAPRLVPAPPDAP